MARSEAAQPDEEQLGLVLLHGAMLGRWIWARVEPLLAGPAIAVDLPGRGSRPADVTNLTLGDVVDSVATDIESWPVEQVVLVAHSLSGILIPALISRLPRRVVRAVFVSAAVPVPGASYLDVLPRSERFFLRLVLLTQRKGLLTPGWAARRALCNDLDEPTTRLVLQGLTREAPGLYGAPVLGDIPASLPTLYVKLSADHGFSPPVQDQMIARLHAPRLEEIGAGHLPMLGHPDRLAAILNSLIAPTRSEAPPMTADRSDHAQDASPPAPHPELKRLEPLVGKWFAEDHTHDSVLGPGVRVTSTESFSWLDGGYFLVSTYETVFGNELAQRGVNYWGYDAEAERFHIIFFSNNGPFTEEGNRYKGSVAGGKLTFEGPARFEYDLDDEGKVKTNADGTISVAWWLRDENNEWQPWMTNTFTKETD